MSMGVKGLVGFANHVQRCLSVPITEAQLSELASQVRATVEQARRAIRHHKGTLRSLPGPSRRALQFLESLDLEGFQTVPESQSGGTQQKLRIRGLKAEVDRCAVELSQIARNHGSQRREILRRIQTTVQDLNGRLHGHEPAELTDISRKHLAWLRFMAQPSHLARYMAAVLQAHAAFDHIAPPKPWLRPIVVLFKPTEHAYRVGTARKATQAILPTGMVGLRGSDFALLAQIVFRSQPGNSQLLHRLLMSRPYQAIQAKLDSLGGAVEQVKGMQHDLADAFARVNARYFDNQMKRPRLTWNNSITRGKFGHYNFSNDTVVISRALDRPEVPRFVLDHVMHHELLHKKHGLQWRGSCGHAHTPEFRQEEQEFLRYREAVEFLESLAAGRIYKK